MVSNFSHVPTLVISTSYGRNLLKLNTILYAHSTANVRLSALLLLYDARSRNRIVEPFFGGWQPIKGHQILVGTPNVLRLVLGSIEYYGFGRGVVHWSICVLVKCVCMF